MRLRSRPVALLLALMACAAGCAGHRMQEAGAGAGLSPAREAAPAAAAAPRALAPASDLAAAFARDVQPILVQRCSPCHFPGGIMHARLPFDDPATVPPIQEAVLRRIKAPDERAALEHWLAGADRP